MKEKRVFAQPKGEKLFNIRPVLFGTIFLAVGILFCFYHAFEGLSAAWLLCLLPMAAAPAFLSYSKGKLWAAAIAFLFLCLCALVGFFGFTIQVNRYEHTAAFGEKYFSGRVVEIREGKYSTALVLDDLVIEGEGENCKLIAYLPTSFCEDIRLSDEVFLRGDIEKRAYETEGFSLFAKDFGKRIFLTSSSPEGYKTGHKFDLFLFLNERIKTVIDSGMDETPAAVTKAVLLGDTSGIESDLYENIRRGGIAHIFAVSGLHVGSLFAFCILLVKKTGLRRAPAWARLALVAFVLVTYAGVCAFSSSVVRATVICLVAYMCKLLLVKTDFLQSLGLAAICILFFNPSALFTVGFQLSFAACFGIAFLAKPIGQVFDECAKLYRHIFPRKLTKAEIEAIQREDTLPPRISARIYRAVSGFLAASLGAQIFTAPLLLGYFGYVSGWALILNCFFVPFISSVFSLLLLTVSIACILPLGLSFIALYLPNVIWSAVLLVFEAVDFTSFALEGLTISAAATVLYLMSTLFFTDKWNLKKSFRFILGGVCILAFTATMVALNV